MPRIETPLRSLLYFKQRSVAPDLPKVFGGSVQTPQKKKKK